MTPQFCRVDHDYYTAHSTPRILVEPRAQGYMELQFICISRVRQSLRPQRHLWSKLVLLCITLCNEVRRHTFKKTKWKGKDIRIFARDLHSPRFSCLLAHLLFALCGP